MEKSERFARTILNGFEVFFAEFQNITLAAKTRFENADWHGLRQSSIERIDLYKVKKQQVSARLQHLCKMNAIAFTAREQADLLLLILATEIEATDIGT